MQGKRSLLEILVAPFGAMIGLFWPILIGTAIVLGILAAVTGKSFRPSLLTFGLIVISISTAVGVVLAWKGDAEQVRERADALLKNDRAIREDMRRALAEAERAISAAEQALRTQRYGVFLDELAAASGAILRYRQRSTDLQANMSQYAATLANRRHTFPALAPDELTGSAPRLLERYQRLFTQLQANYQCVTLLEQRRGTIALGGAVPIPHRIT